MAFYRALCRWPALFNGTIQRHFSRTPALPVKEITVVTNNDVLEISAAIKPSPRAGVLVKLPRMEGGKCASAKICPKCMLGLDVKHTDVLILSQFLRSDGTMMPRRITGLCNVQQRNLGTMVLMARRAGLIALKPQLASKKPNKCFGYKGLNHYFEEHTIKYGRRRINPMPERRPATTYKLMGK